MEEKMRADYEKIKQITKRLHSNESKRTEHELTRIIIWSYQGRRALHLYVRAGIINAFRSLIMSYREIHLLPFSIQRRMFFLNAANFIL